jgi:endo-1,4-beta-xylanase
MMRSPAHQIRFLILFLAATAATPSLREVADHAHLLVGAAVRPSLFSEAAYSATLSREFNMVEPEDAMKWWTVRAHADTFDFREGDEVVRFAQAHDMKVRGHCLVWDHNNPEWLTHNHYTPHQLFQVLEEHVATEVKHYAGQVFAWDVVNEALDENGHLRDSPWYDQPGIGLSDKGTAYIEQAFRWAREADPHALLFYNDNGGEGLNRKSDAIYAMVKDFKQRGVPIDGVGLQMHVPNLELDTDAIAVNIARLTALGVQVHITELAASKFRRCGRETGSSAPGRNLSWRRAGLPAKPGLHCDSNLGIHRQIFVDWLPLSRHPRRCPPFRPHLQAEARLRCHVRGDLERPKSPEVSAHFI